MKQDFMRGSIVRILSANKYKYRKGRYKHEKDLVGNIGTVIATGPDYITVEVNGMRNPTSQTGFYFFDRSELEKVNGLYYESENTYKGEDYQMHQFDDCLNIVEAYLNNDPSHVFLCANYLPDLNIGDCIVIANPNGTRMHVAIATQIHECDLEVVLTAGSNIEAEVICLCDMTEYQKRLELRWREAEKAANRKKLLAHMADRAKKVDQMLRYRILAEHDEEMSELLRQFDDLDDRGVSHGTEEA